MISNVIAFPARSPRQFSLSPQDRAEALAGVNGLPCGWQIEFERVGEGDLAAFVGHASDRGGLSYIIGRCCDTVQITRDREGAWEDLPEASSVPEAFATIADDLRRGAEEEVPSYEPGRDPHVPRPALAYQRQLRNQRLSPALRNQVGDIEFPFVTALAAVGEPTPACEVLDPSIRSGSLSRRGAPSALADA